MAENSKAHKVLIVDDEIKNIKLLGNLLPDEINVIFASTGEEALTIAKSNRPDLILLDINMPGMDGYQVCRVLKSDPETENVPVIFITARNAEHEEAFGLELGAVDNITKPFNSQIVKLKVKIIWQGFQSSELRLRSLAASGAQPPCESKNGAPRTRCGD